jgi:hypothetical protein
MSLIGRGLVFDLDRGDAGARLVDLAHHLAGGGGRGVGRLVALLLHCGGQIVERLIRALGIDQDHEGLAVDGRGHFEGLARIERRLGVKCRNVRNGRAGMDENGVTVRLRAHDIFGGDQTRRARLVLDHDGVAADFLHRVRHVAHDHVGARSRREGAHEADVLVRVTLRLRAGLNRQERGSAEQRRPQCSLQKRKFHMNASMQWI